MLRDNRSDILLKAGASEDGAETLAQRMQGLADTHEWGSYNRIDDDLGIVGAGGLGAD